MGAVSGDAIMVELGGVPTRHDRMAMGEAIKDVKYRLAVLTVKDCEEARVWRNEWRESLRTPFLLTEDMQRDFYQRVVCNRDAHDRYWAIERVNASIVQDGDAVVGRVIVAMTGLTGIQWENGLAEISLIVGPSYHGKGVGSAAVRLVLEEAFLRMRLLTVSGEVYECNTEAVPFWKKVTALAGGSIVTLPRRKWWDGKLWDSLWFTIPADGFRKAIKAEGA